MKLQPANKSDGFTLIELVVMVGLVIILLMVFGMYPRSNERSRAARIQCTVNLKQIGQAYIQWSQYRDVQFPFYVPGLTNEETGIVISSNEVTAEAWMHFRLLSNELASAKVLMCRANRSLFTNAAENFSVHASPPGLGNFARRDASISYFVGLGASPDRPGAILGGDRTIAASETNLPYGVKVRAGAVDVPGFARWTAADSYKLHDWQGNLLFADGSVQQGSYLKLDDRLNNAVEKYGTNANRFLFPR